MKWKRTAMSLALAGCMMATTVPVTAFAANGTETTMAAEQKTASTAIAFAEKSGTVGAGKTIAVALNRTPADADDTVTVSSSDETIATVQASSVTGVYTITGVKKGTATITAKIGKDISATYDVTVTERKQTRNITIAADKTTLDTVDENEAKLTVTYDGDDKNAVTYKSSDTDVVSIDSEGKITVEGEGQAQVYATTTATNIASQDADDEDALADGATITSNVLTITVNKGANHLNGITISRADGKANTALEPKDVVELKADLTGVDQDEDVDDNVTVQWASDNKAVATVDANGKVTAVAKGTATISATAGTGEHQRVGTYEITVTDEVINLTSISLNKTETTLKPGNSETLTVTLNPTGANDLKKGSDDEYLDPTWTVTDVSGQAFASGQEVVSVNNKGKVTAIKEGTAIVTATVQNNAAQVKNFVASCKVTVTAEDATVVKGIAFKAATDYTNLKVSESAAADSSVLDITPTTATVKESDITWTTGDSKIAIVKGGNLIALAEGSTTVTASVNGKTATTTVKVAKNADGQELTGLSVDTKVVAFAEKNADKTVTATATPASFNDYVVWTVADESVAKLEAADQPASNKIKIVAVGAGETTVSATVGGKTETIRVVFVDENTKPDPTGFVDVPDNAWYANAVNTAAAKGLMNGTGNNKFEPLKTVQRSQVAAIVWNIEGAPAVTGTTPFTDVAADAWYAQAVTWAYQNKVVSGTSATTFAPNQNITRQDFAVVLYNKAGKPAASADLSKFVDASKINSWAQDAVKWAVSKGIINGNDKNELNPTGTLTRAEAASIIVKYVG